MLLYWPAPILINHLINLPHQMNRLCKSGHHALIVFNIIELKLAPLAILQPLLTDLIATNMKLPHLWRDALNILRLIDPDTALLRSISRRGIIDLLNHIVPRNWEPCGDLAK